MTPIQPMLAKSTLPMQRHAFRVCWASQVGPSNGESRRQLVLAIDLDSDEQAVVEAWIENDRDRRPILDRRRMRVHRYDCDGMLHVDVMGDNGDGRIAAISLIASDKSLTARPLYAHTKLLATAGFAAGSYDPPVLNRSV